MSTEESSAPPPRRAPQRSDAARNRELLLDAALTVLSERPDAGLVEVARASGLTRTTVYAHFPNREALVESVVQRAIGATVAVLDQAELSAGAADKALRSALASSWRQVSQLGGLAATAHQMLGDRTAELHEPLVERVRSLVRRGRADGCFRTDVPEAWLVTTFFALVHAAGREVAGGALATEDAEAALTATVLGALAAPRRMLAPGGAHDETHG